MDGSLAINPPQKAGVEQDRAAFSPCFEKRLLDGSNRFYLFMVKPYGVFNMCSF